jgi:hypothetical protein
MQAFDRPVAISGQHNSVGHDSIRVLNYNGKDLFHPRPQVRTGQIPEIGGSHLMGL